MEKILYRLDAFEGPLDLLLHLIRKNKVSIYDIPIAEITDQYMEILRENGGDSLDDTSEFVVMAAQLLYIKSKMLLPKEETEEEEDPREELVRRLEEYKLFKEASGELRKTEFAARHMVFREAEKIDLPVQPYSRHHETAELTDAFYSILERRKRAAKPEKRAFYGIVGREKVSVDDMVEKICKALEPSGRVNFSELFLPEDSRPEMIATFLAVLEMIKLSRLRAERDDATDEFVLTRTEETDGDK